MERETSKALNDEIDKLDLVIENLEAIQKRISPREREFLGTILASLVEASTNLEVLYDG